MQASPCFIISFSPFPSSNILQDSTVAYLSVPWSSLFLVLAWYWFVEFSLALRAMFAMLSLACVCLSHPISCLGTLPYISLMRPDARFSILGHGAKSALNKYSVGISEGKNALPNIGEGASGLHVIWMSYISVDHLGESNIKTKFFTWNQIMCNECWSRTSTLDWPQLTARQPSLGDFSVGVMISGMITKLEIRECRVTAWICPRELWGPGGCCLLESFSHVFNHLCWESTAYWHCAIHFMHDLTSLWPLS